MVKLLELTKVNSYLSILFLKCCSANVGSIACSYILGSYVIHFQ